MRRRSLVLCVLALFGCGKSAQQASSVESPVIFDPPLLDFGTRAIGQIYELTTTMKRRADGDLQVTDVRFDPASAAFTAQKSDRGSLRRAFVNSATPVGIVVRYQPATSGDDGRTMIIAFSSVEARLPILAVAESPGSPQPAIEPATIAFGSIEVGRDVTQPFVLRNIGKAPGMPRVVNVPPAFSITANGGGRDISSTQVLPGDARALEAHFKPTVLGRFEGTIDLSFESGFLASLPVSGNGVSEGMLDCSGPSIDFGSIARGTSLMSAFGCQVTGGPFTLASLRVTADRTDLFRIVQAPSLNQTIEAIELRLEARASGLAEPHSGALLVGSAAGSERPIPLTATVIPPDPADTDLSLSLAWDRPVAVLDLHLSHEGHTCFETGHDCWFEDRHIDWGQAGDEADDPFMDRDSRDASEPQQINLQRADGIFDAWVYYEGVSAGREGIATQVTVTYAFRGRAETATKVMSICGNTWHVGRFAFQGGQPAFVPDTAESDRWKDRALGCR